MAAAAWTGSISFGLLTIPIRMYPAARAERINLHKIHSVCHTRLRQPLYCPKEKRLVDRSEVVRGYEREKGRYVLITDEEIEKITPPSSKNMEIQAFVKASQVDPIYFDSSYLATPEKDHAKPYLLLVRALEEMDRVGIAKVALHQREYTVFIRPRNHGLTIHTMYFANEIRSAQGYGKSDEKVQLKPLEMKLAEQLIESLAQNFNPKQYHDTFQENLRALIEAKQEGRSVTVEVAPKRAPVIDIMEALKGSLQKTEAQKRTKHPARARGVGREREARRRLAS